MSETAPPAPPLPAVVPPDARRAVALVVGVVATVAFVALRVAVDIGNRAPFPIDEWWHGLMVASASDPVTTLARIPATVGGTIGMIITGTVIILLFLWRRRPWDAATLAAAMVLVVAIGTTLAAVIARVRPADSMAEANATSFPSGHTAVATTVALILALLLRRWYVWVLGVCWVLGMMWSRTYLRAHWLSDVTAGMLEGIAVTCLVWCAIEAYRDRRARGRTALASAVAD